jgi:Xaa-Pro aminopeptidase
MTEVASPTALKLPFDWQKLDRLMDEAGVDLVLATSKHNVRYLLAGYYNLFFAEMDAIGVSRYVPAVAYPRGNPTLAFYVGNGQDAAQQEISPLWVPTVRSDSWTSEQTAIRVGHLIDDIGLATGTIAVELPFLPADAYLTLRHFLPKATFVNAVTVLEDLRAVKQPHELQLLKEASEAIVDAMLVVCRRAAPGMTTREITDLLIEEEVARDLSFDYCQLATGTSTNRTPSHARWEPGASLSLDSGGNKQGYIGDLARMAVMGRPTREQEELLQEIDRVQMAARQPVKAGALGRAIYDHALAELARCSHRDEMEFLAHGMGLVSHEAPRLTSTGPVPYEADHGTAKLEAGMVISIETTLSSSRHGFIKLEDTIAVTESGWEAYGDAGRGWNVVDY